MTWHRFPRLGDWSPKQRRVQRRGMKPLCSALRVREGVRGSNATGLRRRQVACGKRSQASALQSRCATAMGCNTSQSSQAARIFRSAGGPRPQRFAMSSAAVESKHFLCHPPTATGDRSRSFGCGFAAPCPFAAAAPLQAGFTSTNSRRIWPSLAVQRKYPFSGVPSWLVRLTAQQRLVVSVVRPAWRSL